MPGALGGLQLHLVMSWPDVLDARRILRLVSRDLNPMCPRGE
jgi:hypothetical protein